MVDMWSCGRGLLPYYYSDVAPASQGQPEEEERLLQMALQASSEVNDPIVDPDNPDVDNMTYEQLMEMGSNAGQVNRGYP